MKHLNKVYYIILFIISFIIIGGSSILTADIGFEVLSDPTFYLVQALTYVAIILITVGSVFMVIDSFKEKDLEYKETDKFISDFAKDKRNIPSFLSKFLESINLKRKTYQYKYNIRKKLFYLNAYRPWYWYILPWRWGKRKFNNKDIHIWNYGTEEEKKNNEYCKQRFYLEEQLSEDFINKNISNSYVKYKRITESVILGGYYADINKNGPNEFIETNLTGRIIKNKLPKLMLSFGITFLMSAIIFDKIKFNSNAIMNVCVKLGTLLWNASVALRYGKDLCQTVILKDIRFRKGLITEYDKWLVQQAEQSKEPIENKEVPIQIIKTEKPKEVKEDGREQQT